MIQHLVSFIILIVVMHDRHFDLIDSRNPFFIEVCGLNQFHVLGKLHCDICFQKISDFK